MFHQAGAFFVLAFVSVTCMAQNDTQIFDEPPSSGNRLRHAIQDRGARVISQHYVRPNIRALAAAGLRGQKQRHVRVALPDSASFGARTARFIPKSGFLFSDDGTVTIDPEASDSDISYFWYGVSHGSEASIYVHNGAMAAAITSKGRAFQVGTYGTSQLLTELDPRTFPPEADPIIAQGEVGREGVPTAGSKAPDSIHLLILYTDGAENFSSLYGGIPAMANLMVEQINTTFANSGMTTVGVQNVSPAGAAAAVDYDESPHISDGNERTTAHLNWLRTSPEVAMLRDTYGADLVALIVEDNYVCGRGYLQTASNFGFPFEPLAFSYTSVFCSVSGGSYSASHEIGHNLGMHHDLPNAPSVNVVAFPWSYGHYVADSEPVRTMMSYNTHCGGQACTRQLQFSNPQETYKSRPEKQSGTLAPAGEPAMFNALTGTRAAEFVTAYRGANADTVINRVHRSGFERLQDYVY